jgi:hypothetical protein
MLDKNAGWLHRDDITWSPSICVRKIDTKTCEGGSLEALY